MLVTLPPGAQPGQSLQVTSPDGRAFNFQVPPGVPPGAQISVMLPAPPPVMAVSAATVVPATAAGVQLAPAVVPAQAVPMSWQA